jgi:hypothetical protein
MNVSEQSRRLMEMERKLSRLELKMVAIAAQNAEILRILGALGTGLNLNSNIVVYNT